MLLCETWNYWGIGEYQTWFYCLLGQQKLFFVSYHTLDFTNCQKSYKGTRQKHTIGNVFFCGGGAGQKSYPRWTIFTKKNSGPKSRFTVRLNLLKMDKSMSKTFTKLQSQVPLYKQKKLSIDEIYPEIFKFLTYINFFKDSHYKPF